MGKPQFSRSRGSGRGHEEKCVSLGRPSETPQFITGAQGILGGDQQPVVDSLRVMPEAKILFGRPFACRVPSCHHQAHGKR